MADPKILSTLHKFGMTEREAKLYLAMLERKETTAAELHRISGVMRTKTYETLEQMVSKGYCLERVENKRRFFRAVRPAQLQDMFNRQWEHEQKWKQQTAEKIFGTLDKKFEQQPVDRSLDFIEVLRSMDQIHRRFLAEVKETEKEILGFNRSPYACLDPEVLKEQEKANFESLERGVVSRTVFMMEDEHWSWLEKHLYGAREAGEEVRIIDSLPMKLFIFDRKRVMLALPAVPGQTVADFTMLVVEDAGFTESIYLLFDMFWNSAFTPEQWKQRDASKTGKAKKSKSG
ncbi:MAG: TrmB family transcriptional regulator [Planctomycetota bacterium]|jgi:sugar-specific transcriptional regulator TrmB